MKMTCFSLTFSRNGRFFQPGDDYFQEGDKFCFSNSKHFIQDEDIEQLSSLVSGVSLGKVATISENSLISCEVKGCSEEFDTTKAYEIHFQNSHRFSCRECRLNFPSNFLLDIHIDENHDSYFTAKRERGEAQLVCLVESCTTKFKDEKERQKHLVDIHKYPSNFRFNRSRKKNSEEKKFSGISSHGTLDETMEIDERTSCSEVKHGDSIKGNSPTESKKNIQIGRGIPKTINFGRGSSKMFYKARGKQKR